MKETTRRVLRAFDRMAVIEETLERLEKEYGELEREIGALYEDDEEGISKEIERWAEEDPRIGRPRRMTEDEVISAAARNEAGESLRGIARSMGIHHNTLILSVGRLRQGTL